MELWDNGNIQIIDGLTYNPKETFKRLFTIQKVNIYQVQKTIEVKRNHFITS